MGLISRPHTYVSGATIKSSEHNNNENTIYNEFNGNISNANLSASAAIADTKLAQITTGGKVSTAALTGSYSNVNLTEGSAPTTAANEGALYTKDTSGQPELFYREESDGDEIQLTSAGAINYGLGTWTSRTKDTVYQASTDLIVVALYVPTNAQTGAISGITDSSATPSTVRVKCGQNSGNANVNNMLSITFPVKKDDYWKVEQSGSANSVTIYEIALS